MTKKPVPGVVLITLLLAGLVVIGFGATAANSPVAAAGSGVPTSLVAVTRRDLTDRLNVGGSLGYGAATAVINHLQGTITSEAALGTTVDRGQVLYTVDAKPVTLMFGDTPAYRDFKLGMSDGPDVKELEQNLLALGYGNSSNLIANGHFDSFDVAAIKRWQKALGLTQDGVIPWGMVIFELGAVRISAYSADVGTSAGPVLEVTSMQHVVTIDLDARRQSLAIAGASVTVTLPSGQAVPGTISAVAKSSTAPTTGSGPATIKVYVTLAAPMTPANVHQPPATLRLPTHPN